MNVKYFNFVRLIDFKTILIKLDFAILNFFFHKGFSHRLFMLLVDLLGLVAIQLRQLTDL